MDHPVLPCPRIFQSQEVEIIILIPHVIILDHHVSAEHRIDGCQENSGTSISDWFYSVMSDSSAGQIQVIVRKYSAACGACVIVCNHSAGHT